MVGGGKQKAIPGDRETRISDRKRTENETTREKVTNGERNTGGRSKKGSRCRHSGPWLVQALTRHTSIPPACSLALSFTHAHTQTQPCSLKPHLQTLPPSHASIPVLMPHLESIWTTSLQSRHRQHKIQTHSTRGKHSEEHSDCKANTKPSLTCANMATPHFTQSLHSSVISASMQSDDSRSSSILMKGADLHL